MAVDREMSRLSAKVTAALGARMTDATVFGLRPLHGGSSSLTYVAEVRGIGIDGRIVIKTIPAGLSAKGNRDIVRQGVLMAALFESGLPVPEVLAVSAGSPPASPPFLVTRFVEGDSYDPNARPSEPAHYLASDELTARAIAAMGILARVQRTDLREMPFQDEASISPESEIARWSRAFESTAHAKDPLVHECVAQLKSHLPDPMETVLVHGDFRLGNMLCCGRNVRAVIDWEIWSLGDPRFDLAWFVSRADPTHPAAQPVSLLPPPAVLLEAYRGDREEIQDLRWFFAISAFKNAAASALIDKRRNSVRDPGSRRMSALLRWASTQLE